MVPDETCILYMWQAPISLHEPHRERITLITASISVISLNYIELYIVLYKHVSNV